MASHDVLCSRGIARTRVLTAARPAAHGPRARPSLPASTWAAVVPAILSETRAHRVTLHRATGSDRCDLHVILPGPSGGAVRLEGDCACRDFLVDMLFEAYQLLVRRGDELRNPGGAVRTHLRTRAVGDWIRRRRIEMGAQARCDRIRSGARARTLPDEFHRAVLEFLVDEAGSPAPLDGHHDLVLRLAVRCAAEFGGEPVEHRARVSATLPVVEAACRTGPRVNVGTDRHPEFVTWWERFIERPLGRRPRRSVDALPDAGGDAADPRPVGTVAEPVQDGAVLDRLLTALHQHPGAPESALRDGLAELVAHGLLPARTAAAVLGDRSRMATAARELSALA